MLACVDHSAYADHVADHAAWAARRMAAPLEFLHVIDRAASVPEHDHSGAIGVSAQEKLLDELSAEDEARSREAREQGRLFLNRLRGHSPLRSLLFGSKTTDLLRSAPIPTLLLRR